MRIIVLRSGFTDNSRLSISALKANPIVAHRHQFGESEVHSVLQDCLNQFKETPTLFMAQRQQPEAEFSNLKKSSPVQSIAKCSRRYYRGSLIAPFTTYVGLRWQAQWLSSW
jgi:hypothetical protein